MTPACLFFRFFLRLAEQGRRAPITQAHAPQNILKWNHPYLGQQHPYFSCSSEEVRRPLTGPDQGRGAMLTVRIRSTSKIHITEAGRSGRKKHCFHWVGRWTDCTEAHHHTKKHPLHAPGAPAIFSAGVAFLLFVAAWLPLLRVSRFRHNSQGTAFCTKLEITTSRDCRRRPLFSLLPIIFAHQTKQCVCRVGFRLLQLSSLCAKCVSK